MPLVRSTAFHVDYKDIIMPPREPLVHSHDAIELAYFERADIRVNVGERSYQLGDGDIMLLDKYDSHRIEYVEGKPYTRYVVNFSEAFVEEVLQAAGRAGLLKDLFAGREPKVRTTTREQRGQLVRSLSSLWTMFQAMPGSAERDAFLRLQTGCLLLLYHTLPAKAETRRPTMQSELAGQMLAYLDEHYKDNLSLPAMARHFHLSKYYLGHSFKEATGMTMNDYVQFKRVTEARQLLKDTDKSVLDVSLECGFNSVQHFHRIFKKLTRMTPYQYRRLT